MLGALAFVETEAGNHGFARDLAEQALAQRPESGGATHAIVGEVCQALADLESGNARSAAECLLDREDELVVIGGSRAQLELLEDTLTAALHRSGRGSEAADRLNRRLARRASTRDQRWLASID